MDVLKSIGLVSLTTLLSLVVLFLLTKLMGAKQVSQMTMFDYVEGITIGSVAAELATNLDAPLNSLTALVLYGLAAVFCGVTNCPLASTLLAVELFGAEGLLYFALACCLSYMLSGYQGLYSSQTILYSKLKAQFINVHTNAHHAGELPTEEAQAK